MLFSGVNLVKADSGWDSSYDSGGGWDSGGSWDSGWDSGGSWSSSSLDGSYSDGDGFAFMIIFAVVVIIIIYFSINNRGGKGGSGSTSNFNKYSDIKDELSPSYINFSNPGFIDVDGVFCPHDHIYPSCRCAHFHVGEIIGHEREDDV